ncbi:hypothetical protein F5888DRAFT_1908739 [Russula emetica]|nr:hypothetical protein F5888DRAFT_1908739 [Russula emetica]
MAEQSLPDTSNTSPLRSTHHAPAAGPSRGRRSNPLQSLIRSRTVVPTSAPTYGSCRLTPAGAIAQAYKEQDIRREALAATASADIILPIIPSPSLRHHRQYPYAHRQRSSSLNRLRKKNDPSSLTPEIPTFSISDVVNSFVSRRPSLAHHQRGHAPARSLPRIEPPPIGEVSGALLRHAGSEARSMGSLAGQCTFRELGTARGQVWTSQEKEDKWDDLLERSAWAGGTLHLGAGSTHLASDDIRFSSGTLELET